VLALLSETHVSLKDEIKKKRPFEHIEEEAYLNLLRTTTVLYAQFECLLKRSGLTEPQYNVLRILRGVGTGGCGVPSSEVGARMITRVPDVTRLVDRLEAAGLVERCRIAEDRRVVQVKITAKGLQTLAQLDQPLLDLNKRLLRHMTRQELKDLIRLLERMRHPPDEAALLRACKTEAPQA
jgi:DNA-binding MarR family transcriptional regulator